MDPLIEPLPAVTVSHLATVSARPLLSVRHQTAKHSPSLYHLLQQTHSVQRENIIAAKTFIPDKKAGRYQQNPNLYRRPPPSLGARQAGPQ